jgi:hypothetical protein
MWIHWLNTKLFYCGIKNRAEAGRQPVILATWEAEIRRILVGGQSRQMVLKIPNTKMSGSSYRTRALQVQSPEFKSHSHQERKLELGKFLIIFCMGGIHCNINVLILYLLFILHHHSYPSPPPCPWGIFFSPPGEGIGV